LVQNNESITVRLVVPALLYVKKHPKEEIVKKKGTERAAWYQLDYSMS